MDPAPVRVTVDLPAEVVAGASPGEVAGEALRLFVLDRFRTRDLSAARAARILGLDRLSFLDLCAAHDVPVLRYDQEDFERELADIRAMGR